MKVGIIVYSKTGNTHSVGQKIREKLEQKDYPVELHRIEVEGEGKPGESKVKFTNFPGLEDYDFIILGAPVHAFSLAQPMMAYLQEIPELKGKKVALYVTKQLPGAWTGGNRAAGQMEKICADKGAEVKGKEVVFWNEKKREESINKCVEKMASLF